MEIYHAGSRELQNVFGSTALADRLADKTRREQFSDGDKTFIETAGFFFLATASVDGKPDCSFKAGPKGFVRILAPDLLVFPDYDGNGMFRSLGNIRVNPFIAMLFITMDEALKRLRVNGRACVSLDDDLLARFAGAQAIVRVVPEHIFPNCPRYIPDLKTGTESIYLPKERVPPSEPAWKGFEAFSDVVPPRRATKL